MFRGSSFSDFAKGRDQATRALMRSFTIGSCRFDGQRRRVCHKICGDGTLTALYDTVLIPPIGQQSNRRAQGSLTAGATTSPLQRIHEIIDDFSGWKPSRNDADEQKK